MHPTFSDPAVTFLMDCSEMYGNAVRYVVYFCNLVGQRWIRETFVYLDFLSYTFIQ